MRRPGASQRISPAQSALAPNDDPSALLLQRNPRSPRLLLWSIIISLLAASVMNLGCASSQPPGSEDRLDQPPAGQAHVVFMRPSSFSGAAPSVVVVDITDGPKMVGILRSGDKAIATVPATERTFIATSGGARAVIAATLDAGKTYYVRVSWRPSLSPMRRVDAIQQYWVETELVSVTNRVTEWYEKNQSSVTSHKRKARLTGSIFSI